MLENIYENATKYAPKGSSIYVRLHTDGDRARVSIEDEGSGISNEHKEKIFKKFYRIGDERTRTTKGTGLGLYIVKELAAQIGAEVGVFNRASGGTQFTISFHVYDNTSE
jgi:signal transduction histidine kinase